MVVIVVHTIEGKTEEVRKEIIKGITDVFVKLGSNPDRVKVLLNEIAPASWGTGGIPQG